MTRCRHRWHQKLGDVLHHRREPGGFQFQPSLLRERLPLSFFPAITKNQKATRIRLHNAINANGCSKPQKTLFVRRKSRKVSKSWPGGECLAWSVRCQHLATVEKVRHPTKVSLPVFRPKSTAGTAVARGFAVLSARFAGRGWGVNNSTGCRVDLLHAVHYDAALIPLPALIYGRGRGVSEGQSR